MKKTLVFTLVVAFLATISAPAAMAQNSVDHWSTREAALAATGSPWYYPSLGHEHALGPGELFGGMPYDAVVEMVLPDRAGGRGFVRIEAGRKTVFSSSGTAIRLAACNNAIFSLAPINVTHPAAGAFQQQQIVLQFAAAMRGEKGDKGDTGPQGPQGVMGPAGPVGCHVVAVRDNKGKWHMFDSCTNEEVKSGGIGTKTKVVVGVSLAALFFCALSGKCKIGGDDHHIRLPHPRQIFLPNPWTGGYR